MIASTPVARWSWGETGRETDLVREAVRRFFLALRVLDRYGLAAPHGGRVAVVVSGRAPGALCSAPNSPSAPRHWWRGSRTASRPARWAA